MVSPGTSTITGAPRPFFRRVKARRMMLQSSFAAMTGSTDLEMSAIDLVAL